MCWICIYWHYLCVYKKKAAQSKYRLMIYGKCCNLIWRIKTNTFCTHISYLCLIFSVWKQIQSLIFIFCFFQMVTRTKKIFVGGLSAPTTLEDVKSYFEQFGPVRILFYTSKQDNVFPSWVVLLQINQYCRRVFVIKFENYKILAKLFYMVEEIASVFLLMKSSH